MVFWETFETLFTVDVVVLQFESSVRLLIAEGSEDSGEARRRHREVLNEWNLTDVLELHLGQAFEQVGEAANAILIDSSLDEERQVGDRLDLAFTEERGLVDDSVEVEVHVWHGLVDELKQLILGLFLDLDSHLVASSVIFDNLLRISIANHLTVDHDTNFLAEKLSFVHTVSGQHQRTVLHSLQKSDNFTSADGVDTGSWLVQDKNLRTANESHCGAKLTLVATRQVAGLYVNEILQIALLAQEIFLEFDILLRQTLDLTHELKMLVDSQVVPQSVRLSHTGNESRVLVGFHVVKVEA